MGRVPAAVVSKPVLPQRAVPKLTPDLDELVAMRGAAHGMDLRMRQPAAAQLQGGHRSAHRGRGLEFDEVRAYAPGDDARSIDWRVTARRGRPHTKLFREERERLVWLLADLHPGLYFGSRCQLKSALLLRAAAWLAWVTVTAGDRLGAVVRSAADNPTHAPRAPCVLPPRSREIGALAVLQSLVRNQPRQPRAPAALAMNAADTAAGTARNNGRGGTDSSTFSHTIHTLQPLVRSGSTVVVLSDFSDTGAAAAAADAALAALAMRADCRLIWLTDALERDGLPAGAFRVGVPGRLWSVDGTASRTAWSAAWTVREQRVADLSRRLRMPVLRLDTSDDLVQSLPVFISESR
jgi:hypothetical protein